MAATSFFQDLLLKYVVDKVPFSINWHVGLFLGDASFSYNEVSNGEYSRLAVTWSDYANSNQLLWLSSTPWGTVTRVALCSGPTGGALIQRTVSVNMSGGVGLRIQPGNLTISAT